MGQHPGLAAHLLTVLILLATRGTYAYPGIPATRSSYTGTLQSANCGLAVQVLINVTETVELSTDYLLDSNGQLPHDCIVSWRVAVRTSGLENYGIRVTGSLSLEDPLNVGGCKSSALVLTDQDDEGDTTAVTQKLCGTRSISYLTYQDSVTVQLQLSVSGAAGRGFSITFSPVLACGGLVSGPVGTKTTLQTPLFPRPYPLDLSCTWDVQAPEGSEMRMECSKFALLRRRKGVCKDYLMIQYQGQLKFYCSKDLAGKKRALTIHGNQLFIYFRSAGRYNPSPGFMCTITFLPPPDSST
uniref:Cubilin-like n=1 Tax=Hirondellea gigas TaxID=1518452 RepID=A0A6A7FNG1_9CRUS